MIGLCAASALAGCADIQRATSLPPVNPESPVASAVTAAARRTPPLPSFRDVPPMPKNLPTPAALKLTVTDMVRCRRAFQRFDAAHPQLVADTPAFAEQLRGRVDTDPADVPTAQDTAEAERYAAGLRAYAAPPPAILSGPPPDPAEASPDASPAGRPPARRAAAPAAAIPAPPPAAPPPAGPVSAAVAPPGVAIPALPPAGPDPLLAHCP